MLRTIVLHGALKDEFGESFPLDIASPAEAIRALCIMVKGFREHLREGAYAIVRGKIDDGMGIRESALTMRLGGASELHIVPVVAGGAWWHYALAGATLLALAFIAPYALPGLFAAGGALAGSIGGVSILGVTAGIGASLAISGVAQLLAPAPQLNNADAAVDQRQSFLFGGLTNISRQGGPVPLIYGIMRVGSVEVSAGVDSADVGVAGAFATPSQ